MTLSDKVIIEVGINENRSRDQNPHVPLTPEEVAADARRCCDAGAAVVHYHGRGPAGEIHDDEPETNIRTQRLVNSASSIVAYPTYGNMCKVFDGWYTIGGPAAQRYRHFVAGVAAGVRFELAPIDLGAALDINAFRAAGGGGDHLKALGADGAGGEWIVSSGHQINTGEDHRWLTAFCQQHHLKITFAVFDTVHLQNLRNIVDMGWIDGGHMLVKLFFLGDNEGPRKLLYYVDRMRELFPRSAIEWLPVVYGGSQWRMNTLALSLGGHVRVGLGDHPYTDLGNPTNAQLVERMAAICRAMGREPATPDEARRILAIDAARAGRQ
ncbi:MAG: 3-keto-5-aminohexanoate cleavage protein [Gammaproteobacteria bacterium]